jgi:EXPERA (EXPanded EBP superfamily)
LFFVLWINQDLLIPLGLSSKSSEYYSTRVDPIIHHPPSWVRTIQWFAFATGPVFLVAAYGFFRDQSWLPYVVLPLAGAMVTSTGIYVIADVTGDVPPLNLTVFYVSNLPYIVILILAAIWVVARMGRRSSPVSSAGA